MAIAALRSRLLSVCAVAFLLLASTARAGAQTMDYELRFGKPNTHLMEITIRATGLPGGTAEFAMPAWAPGSYVIQDYAANVQDFRATGATGKPLASRKTDKQTWRVELAGETAVTVAYKLYANTLANNQAQVNDRHVFIGGPAVWMYLVAGKTRPIRLKIETPAGWRVATGMKRSPDGTFAAADYDWLADSPIEISDFVEQTFEYEGATYHLAVHDVLGRKDFSKFTADTKKFVTELVQMMAPVAGGTSAEGKRRAAPFDHYWFIYHIWPGSRGGLEHLESTQINFSTDWDDIRPDARYGNLYLERISVASHEFFHSWNVKRLRPKPLGPFDYSREAHTTSLWVSEGLTTYWGDLALARSGVMSPQEYLDSIGRLLTEFEQQPGRKIRSIEETSWDTWFRPANLRQDSNLANTQYSYYDGGQVIGHLLDFAIREATDNKKSLDDWLRLLYSRHALPKPGFAPEDLVRAANETAGRDLSDIFRRYVSDKEPIPYETYFAYAGIEVERSASKQAWLGATLSATEDVKARITNVIPLGPAEQAGLDRADIIVAANGRALSRDEFLRLLEERQPGEALNLTIERMDQLQEVTVRLAADPNVRYRLKPIEKPNSRQSRIYAGWLGLRK